MNDHDYGEAQRQARVFNERLFIDWRNDKPRYRPHWRAVLAGLLMWVLIALVVLLLRS